MRLVLIGGQGDRPRRLSKGGGAWHSICYAERKQEASSGYGKILPPDPHRSSCGAEGSAGGHAGRPYARSALRTRVRAHDRPFRSSGARDLPRVATKPYHGPGRCAWPGSCALPRRQKGFRKKKHIAIALRRDASGEAHNDAPSVLPKPTSDAKLLIARLEVCMATHHLAHGGAETNCHFATPPKTMGPMAAGLPRLPSETTIARVRRKTRGGVAGTASRLYAVREANVVGPLNWSEPHNPQYKDVTEDPARLSGIPGVSDAPGMMAMGADGGFLPDDLGPAPGQYEVGDEASEAGYETGGTPRPRVIPQLQRGSAEVDRIRQGAAGWRV